jgi:hypothetical protein
MCLAYGQATWERESPKSAVLRKRRVALPMLVSDDSYSARERFLLGRRASQVFSRELNMMTQGHGAAVYRVCGSDSKWEVFREPSRDPVASFNHKHDALSYAMSLARGRADWHLFANRHRATAASGSGIAGSLPA